MGRAGLRRGYGFWLAIACAACSDSKPSEAPVSSAGDQPGMRTDSGSSAPQEPPSSARDAAAARSDAQAAVSERDARVSEPAPPDEPSSPSVDAGREPSKADASASEPPAAGGCKPRALAGADGIRFHHVHFNSVSPDDDMAFYDKFFGVKAETFCESEDGTLATRATRTERGYFLYTRVTAQPDPALNTYLEHIGWIHANPAAELTRLFEAGATLAPLGRGQCETAVMGTMPCNNYWFYLQAPNGARVEVARGPGPATSGFGHVHMVMGVDFAWLGTVTNGSIANKVIDMVNHTDVAIEESSLSMLMVADTRGKPIDHLGYSTTNLDAEKERILAAGIELAEDISWKREYGFRSFFVRSEKGVWIEIVEDSPFTPTAP
jgi:hypothetical protein